MSRPLATTPQAARVSSDHQSAEVDLEPTAGSLACQSDVGIRVGGLSKCYRIYDRPQDRLKQAIAGRASTMAKRIFPGWRPPVYYREFWALRDVSFSVGRGEAVGIVGRNGAGKSTLLQIIAGTLTPTAGTVDIEGKVAALLELGSGFSPEFTGRENVYLNASLLGLSREETDARFDDIAAFADIGAFIDQPVKTYSSGMLVRLAFAVQTVVEPQILIVDEALAVGDMFFQAKCMVRLRRLMSHGVTILFVSHDIGTVRQLCSSAILLDGGKILEYGPVQRVTDHYQRLDFENRNRLVPDGTSRRVASGTEMPHAEIRGETGEASADELTIAPAEWLGDVARFREMVKSSRSGNGAAEIVSVQLLRNGEVLEVFDYGDVVTLRQVARFHQALDHVNVCYKIRTLQGVDVVFSDTRLTGDIVRSYLKDCVYVFEWTFRLDLMHGNYAIMSGLAHPPRADHDDWIFIDIVPTSLVFRVAPRKAGMIDGLVVWNNSLAVRRLADADGPFNG
ncbi:MAG: ABC transporter ATP-binding protein [Nitrospiraceae bacterium]